MSEREVYIGNEKTIIVKDNEEVRYYLDINKLQKLIEQYVEVTVGAIGDWFFTAININKDELEKIKSYEKFILRSSGWSRFVAKFNDQEEDVTVEIPLQFAEYSFREGFYDGLQKIQFWFYGLYHDCIKKLDYETIKKLQEEINPIIEKYKSSSPPQPRKE